MAFKEKNKDLKIGKLHLLMSDTQFNFVLCAQTLNNRPCEKDTDNYNTAL